MGRTESLTLEGAGERKEVLTLGSVEKKTWTKKIWTKKPPLPEPKTLTPARPRMPKGPKTGPRTLRTGKGRMVEGGYPLLSTTLEPYTGHGHQAIKDAFVRAVDDLGEKVE